MDADKVWELFLPLWDDMDEADEFFNKKPLLAHYTSIETLGEIVKNNQIWFSNPLLMNDLEEVRFGINTGASRFHAHEGLRKACGSQKRNTELQVALDYFYDQLSTKHAFDYYTLCLSEHDADDDDGLLSMWRGYGGNGNGAALILDLAMLSPAEDSPFILAKVHYGTTDERIEWIDTKLDETARIIEASSIPDDLLYMVSNAFFERLKLFSLFSKHKGFGEEREWRVVYMRDRDEEKRLDPMLDFHFGPNGVEPKMKFDIGPIDGATGEELSLERLVAKIILGPSVGGDLAIHGVRRMLQKVGHPALADRLTASTTPFRQT